MGTILAVGFNHHLLAILQSDTGHLDIVPAPDFNICADLLSERNDVGFVICALDSDDPASLAGIQNIRSRFPDIATLAMFDVRDNMMHTAVMLGTFLDNLLAKSAAGALPPIRCSVPDHTPPSGNYHWPIEKIKLTPRQQDVLRLVRDGYSNKEIARILHLSEGTIKVHCLAIYRECGVANRTQAAMLATQLPMPGGWPVQGG